MLRGTALGRSRKIRLHAPPRPVGEQPLAQESRHDSDKGIAAPTDAPTHLHKRGSHRSLEEGFDPAYDAIRKHDFSDHIAEMEGTYTVYGRHSKKSPP